MHAAFILFPALVIKQKVTIGRAQSHAIPVSHEPSALSQGIGFQDTTSTHHVVQIEKLIPRQRHTAMGIVAKGHAL